ncbi:glycogen debranching N-terminal domain-containing protein [Pseudolysinimonas kribbensis]|uniref:glycogen debranching N-terminal domain-containing protein n=1 Tax=Pseudolysinimonas kribbensis TaxID=433641 RepID=UPI0032B0008A
MHGVYVGDIRVLRGLRLTVGGAVGEHLLTTSIDAGTVEFTTLFRGLDGPGADPDVRGTLTRRVTADGVEHRFELSSRLPHDLAVELVVELEPDLTPMSAVKEGVIPGAGISPTRTDEGIEWSGGGVRARITGAGWDATLSDSFTPPVIAMRGRLRVPAHGAGSAGLALRVRDEHAVVRAAGPATIARPASRPADDRLARWLDRALGDLDALRLETSDLPGEAFLAAGAPWFLTLFGRDAIWAARMLLPLDTRMAGGTLRVLAALQGTRDDPGLAEQPGKILHELRRDELALPSQGIRLPPRYYGTIDATPLWVSLLADARRAGLPDGEVRALTPNLRAALHWMRDAGDSDGDGLLEYVDTSGRGLANQGWKDSGDSVQWRDGRLAEGPIALCEVQAYAHRAALDGAELLDAFGDHGEGDAWRAWAEALAQRFRTAFWIDDPAGAYPAIALDAHKRPVDTVTSNIGHLLGTGLLNRDEAALVAQRLVSPSSRRGTACAPSRRTPPDTGRSATTAAASGPTTPRSPSPDSQRRGSVTRRRTWPRACCGRRSRSSTGCRSSTAATPRPRPPRPPRTRPPVARRRGARPPRSRCGRRSSGSSSAAGALSGSARSTGPARTGSR